METHYLRGVCHAIFNFECWLSCSLVRAEWWLCCASAVCDCSQLLGTIVRCERTEARSVVFECGEILGVLCHKLRTLNDSKPAVLIFTLLSCVTPGVNRLSVAMVM